MNTKILLLSGLLLIKFGAEGMKTDTPRWNGLKQSATIRLEEDPIFDPLNCFSDQKDKLTESFNALILDIDADTTLLSSIINDSKASASEKSTAIRELHVLSEMLRLGKNTTERYIAFSQDKKKETDDIIQSAQKLLGSIADILDNI